MGLVQSITSCKLIARVQLTCDICSDLSCILGAILCFARTTFALKLLHLKSTLSYNAGNFGEDGQFRVNCALKRFSYTILRKLEGRSHHFNVSHLRYHGENFKQFFHVKCQ